MKIIAHRGNLSGPIPDLENCPKHIEKVANSYDVEIDVRVVKNQIFLGHDSAQYQVSLDWILKYKDRLWIHCKNLSAMRYFSALKNHNLIYFGHSDDQYVAVSNGYIFCIGSGEFDHNCIIVMPEFFSTKYDLSLVGGVVTDYPLIIKSQIPLK